MRILFVDAPHRPWEFFPGIMPSPGLLAVIPSAHSLRKKPGITVLDLSLELDPAAALAVACKELKPDVVAISGAKSAFAYETLNAAALVRKFAPGALLVGGGNFLSSYAEEVIERGYFDVIATGEGEKVFAEVLSAVEAGRLSDLEKTSGIAYMEEIVTGNGGAARRIRHLREIFAGRFSDGGACDFHNGASVFGLEKRFAARVNRPAPAIENLDSLPLPAFEYFDMDSYTLPPLGGKVGFVTSFSRGCVKKCSFCADSAFWGHKWRGFGAGRCLEILKLLYGAYGRRVFYFGDGDFWQNAERNAEFLELLESEKKRGFEINFWIQSSVDNILANAPLIKRYRAAGLYQVMCGFESVSAQAQRSYKKVISVEKMKAVSALLKKSGVLLMGMLMWGDRRDTAETLAENLEFMVSHCDVIGPNTVVAHYGTRYFDECAKRFGISKFDVLENDQCEIIFPTDTLSVEEASSVYRNMVLKTLISKKKFIANYLDAKNARVKKIVAELVDKGYVRC